MCDVCHCASSAKSVLIVFDDRSDVSEETMQVTVPSLPKENGVPVKINGTELRSRQANFIFNKNNNHFGFHGCVSTRSYAQKNTRDVCHRDVCHSNPAQKEGYLSANVCAKMLLRRQKIIVILDTQMVTKPDMFSNRNGRKLF